MLRLIDYLMILGASFDYKDREQLRGDSLNPLSDSLDSRFNRCD